MWKGVVVLAMAAVGAQVCYDAIDSFNGPGTCQRLITQNGLSCAADFAPGGSLQYFCNETCGLCAGGATGVPTLSPTPCASGVVDVSWSSSASDANGYYVTENYVALKDVQSGEDAVDRVVLIAGDHAERRCVPEDACVVVQVGGGTRAPSLRWSGLSFESQIAPFAAAVCEGNGQWSRAPVVFEGAVVVCEGGEAGYETTIRSGYVEEVSLTLCAPAGSAAPVVFPSVGENGLLTATTASPISESYAFVTDAGAIIFPVNSSSSSEATETTWRVVDVALSDSIGDGWDNGYELIVTSERSGIEYFRATLVDGSFEAKSVILKAGECYLADLTAGPYAQEESWSLCDGVVSGTAPARGVKFCVDPTGTCLAVVDAPGAQEDSLWNDKLTYEWAPPPDDEDDDSCGGPFPSKLTLRVGTCDLSIEASSRDDRESIVSAVAASSFEVLNEVGDPSNFNWEADFLLTFDWARISFFAAAYYDDDYFYSGGKGGSCDADASNQVKVSLRYDEKGLFVRVDNGAVTSTLDRNLGYRFSLHQPGSHVYEDYVLEVEDSVLDGHGDSSIKHWAFACPLYDPFRRDPETADGRITAQQGAATANGVEVSESGDNEDFNADCDGPNEFTLKFDGGSSGSAVIEICALTVPVSTEWRCRVATRRRGPLVSDYSDDDARTPGQYNYADDYYNGYNYAYGGGGGYYYDDDYYLYNYYSDDDYYVGEGLRLVDAETVAFPVAGGGYGIGAKGSTSEDDYVECGVVYDTSIHSSGTLVATLKGVEGPLGIQLVRAHVDGILALIGEPADLTSTTTYSGTFKVDCAKATVKLAIEGAKVSTTVQRQMCGGQYESDPLDWRCAPGGSDDDGDWRTADLEEATTTWPRAVADAEGFLSCPGSPQLHPRLRADAAVAEANRRPCEDQLQDGACAEIIADAVETQINLASAGADLCAQSLLGRCQASCGSCSEDHPPLAPEEPPPCVDLDVVLTDSWGDGWNGALYVIRELIPPESEFDDDAYGRDTIRLEDTMVDARTDVRKTICLQADRCYSFSTTAGDFPDEIGWAFCGQQGAYDESFDLCVVVVSEEEKTKKANCEKWLNRDRGADAWPEKRLTSNVVYAPKSFPRTNAVTDCQRTFSDDDDVAAPATEYDVSLPEVSFFLDGLDLASVKSVYLNRASSSNQDNPEAGDAAIFGASPDVPSNHTKLATAWYVGVGCANGGGLVTEALAEVDFELRVVKEGEIFAVDADSLTLEFSSSSSGNNNFFEEVPNAMGFGYRAVGYDPVLVYRDEPSSEAASYYYRVLQLPNAAVVVARSDGAPEAVRDGPDGSVVKVLTDGIYDVSCGSQCTSEAFCDGEAVARNGATFALFRGECVSPAEFRSLSSKMPSSPFFESSLVEWDTTLANVAGGPSSSSSSCLGVDLPEVQIEVTGTASPPSADWCSATVLPVYDGPARVVSAEVVQDDEPRVLVAWEDEEARLCEKDATLEVEIQADYAFPKMVVAVTATVDSAFAGYEFSDGTTTSRHFLGAGEFPLLDDDRNTTTTERETRTWREEFHVDCAAAGPVVESGGTATVRALDRFDLFVNGIFVVAGFGRSTLFDQADLPVTCDGTDVLAFRAVAAGIDDARAAVRARFELNCGPSPPMVVETDAVDWYCVSVSPTDENADDLTWTTKSLNDAWPQASPAAGVPTGDGASMPSDTSKWISSADAADVVLCRRVVSGATPGGSSGTLTPTPAPTRPRAPSPAPTTPAPKTQKKSKKGGDDDESPKDDKTAALTITAIVVGVFAALFLAFVAYPTLLRYVDRSPFLKSACCPAGWSFSGGTAASPPPHYRLGGSRETELNEVMMPPSQRRDLDEEASSRVAPTTTPVQRPSLADRISALHRNEDPPMDGPFHTSGSFHRLEDANDDDELDDGGRVVDAGMV